MPRKEKSAPKSAALPTTDQLSDEKRLPTEKRPVTIEELGLTAEEMELFATGCRHLFGTGKTKPRR